MLGFWRGAAELPFGGAGIIAAGRKGGRKAVAMPGKSGHGREPEPVDEILDCLAYVQAVHHGNDEGANAALDVLHMRLAGRTDALTPPLRLACLIVNEAARQGSDVDAVLAGVRGALGAGDHATG